MVVLRTFYCFNKRTCDISVTPVLTTKERYTNKLYIGTKTIKEQFIKRKRKETSPHGPRVSHVSRIN